MILDDLQVDTSGSLCIHMRTVHSLGGTFQGKVIQSVLFGLSPVHSPSIAGGSSACSSTEAHVSRLLVPHMLHAMQRRCSIAYKKLTSTAHAPIRMSFSRGDLLLTHRTTASRGSLTLSLSLPELS